MLIYPMNSYFYSVFMINSNQYSLFEIVCFFPGFKFSFLFRSFHLLSEEHSTSNDIKLSLSWSGRVECKFLKLQSLCTFQIPQSLSGETSYVQQIVVCSFFWLWNKSNLLRSLDAHHQSSNHSSPSRDHVEKLGTTRISHVWLGVCEFALVLNVLLS